MLIRAPRLAPGIPNDYYRAIYEVEQQHFWYRGMREIAAALLGERLARPGLRIFDAGCGTGGFLRWALDQSPGATAAGVDVGAAAIELAHKRVPEADLRTAALRELPFAAASFDLVVTNDVLQHVAEEDVGRSLAELRRVLAPAGTLLARTNGSRTLRRERNDWRAYDRATLVQQLAGAGFEVERCTYANTLLSLWGTLRGRTLHAPSESRDGLPRRVPSPAVSAIGSRILSAEARWLARPGHTLPYGYTLFALARRAT